MKIELEVTSATILTGIGTDILDLVTTLPSPVYPYDEPLSLSVRLAMGTGEEYVRKHFPDLKPEVIRR